MGTAVNGRRIVGADAQKFLGNKLNSTYWGPNWDEVAAANDLPAGELVDLSRPRQPEWAQLDVTSFGHQKTRHVGGVPGRIGGCNRATRLYALRGAISGQLLTWTSGDRSYVFVHDQREELEYLITGNVASEPLPRGFPLGETIWIKDHPAFQSVCWPLDPSEFQEWRK
jgi:hypothetical protein